MVSQLPPTGPILPAASVTSTPPTDTPSTWRVGQILAATVVANPRPGQAELRIGNLQVRAQTALEFPPGQQLRLEVASLKEQPVLKLLGLLQANPLTGALRDALPRQQPLAPFLTALARIAAGAQPQLPPAVARFAREVFERLPDAASVATASGLRQALRDSGLFLETKLAHGPPPTGSPKSPVPSAETSRDFKANLLRLVNVLRENSANSAPATRHAVPPAGSSSSAPSAATVPPLLAPGTLNAALSRTPSATPPELGAPLQRGQPPLPPLTAAGLPREQDISLTSRELHRQAEAALARVQLNQLSSLPQERQAGTEWLIELPVRREQDTDIWNLRISRDADQGGDHGQADAGGGWSVMLAFDLPGIGPLQTRVNLRGEQISAQFFSRTPGTLALVQGHLPLLQARLRQAGLRVDDLSCHAGQIPTTAAPARARLLDEHV